MAGSGLVSETAGDDAPPFLDLIAAMDSAVWLEPLPVLPGHGLWVARRIADQMQVLSGPRGTRATLIFELPAQ
jgi:hypothetical protein